MGHDLQIGSTILTMISFLSLSMKTPEGSETGKGGKPVMVLSLWHLEPCPTGDSLRNCASRLFHQRAGKLECSSTH